MSPTEPSGPEPADDTASEEAEPGRRLVVSGVWRPGGPRLDALDPAVIEGLTDFERAVVEVLVATGPGDVLSYGEVAAEAGYPGAARAVGNILARIEGLPWWRIVTASGRLVPHHAEEHARLLAAEGVTCRRGHVVPADR